jgi:hypothetical protein
MSHCGEGSDLRILNAVLNVHVLEFTGLEDLAAFFALHEFRFLVAAHNLHTWVLAGLLCAYVRRRDRRLCGHVIRIVPKVYSFRGNIAPEFLGIVERPDALSSPLPPTGCEFVTGYQVRKETPSLMISDSFCRIISTRSAQSTYHSTPLPGRSLLPLAPGFSGNVQ